MREKMDITIEQSEQLQCDIIAHCDGLPDELINNLCQVVVDYYQQHKTSDNIILED